MNNSKDGRHIIRRGFQSNVNAQLDEIVELLDELDAHGLQLLFDNSNTNHYKLIDERNNEYTFSLYRDVKNALLLILNNL